MTTFQNTTTDEAFDESTWEAQILAPPRSPWEDPKLVYMTSAQHRIRMVIMGLVALAAAALDALIMIPVLERAFRSSTGLAWVIGGGIAVVATITMLIAGYEARGLPAAPPAPDRQRQPSIRRYVLGLCLSFWLLVAIAVFALRLSTSHDQQSTTAFYEGSPAPDDSTLSTTNLWAGVLFLGLYALGGMIAFIDGYRARNDAHTTLMGAQRERDRLAPQIAAKRALLVQLVHLRELAQVALSNASAEKNNAIAANAALQRYLKAFARVMQATLLQDPRSAGITSHPLEETRHDS